MPTLHNEQFEGPGMPRPVWNVPAPQLTHAFKLVLPDPVWKVPAEQSAQSPDERAFLRALMQRQRRERGGLPAVAG